MPEGAHPRRASGYEPLARVNIARNLGYLKVPDDAQITTARNQALLGRLIQKRFPRYYALL